jgi:hypothetical protein
VRAFLVFLGVLFLTGLLAVPPPAHADEDSTYRTPLAGEAYTGQVLGHTVIIEPRDRRSVSSWSAGLGFYTPMPEGRGLTPFPALYFWRHPEDRNLFRAEVSGVYDDIFRSRPLGSSGHLEWVLTFNNYSVPFTQTELIDGRQDASGELLWVYIRPGAGIGYRRQVSPGHQENMFAADLILEPSFLLFDKGSRTASDYVIPDNTMEIRTRLQVRWDALERNILELPHRGKAAGCDIVYGDRTQWGKWGVDIMQGGRSYSLFTGYFVAAGGIPGVVSDRHRLLGYVNGGVGTGLDRFSSPRVGGGLNPVGEEYGVSWRPVLPGAAVDEFLPRHYLLASGQYRWEPVFFTYLSMNAGAGWLDRLTGQASGIVRKNGLFPWIGGKVTTGFFFHTRLDLACNYNFSVIRNGRHGGGEFLAMLSGNF